MQAEPKATVLLVDDHPENLIALEATLNGLGQDLVKAHSGAQALKCLLDQDFALILLDVQMPGMDGFETAALIRQRSRSRSTPIIFLTAFSDADALRSKGYALGAVDYLLKPIDPVILTAKVAVFVDLFKKNIEVQQQAQQLVAKNLEILRVEAARKQAEDANRIKDEFLAVVSHELRTPLNSILGWSQLLLSKKFDEAKTVRALETIARNAKSQAQLIEDILDVSKLMRGKVRLSLQPINAIAIIESVIESVRPLADEKAIELVAQLNETGQLISADPERLRQIIWNLLTNAIKFTLKGGQVTVKWSIADKQNFAHLHVIDTGIGISPDFLPHIFEHFRQADSSSTRSHGGLGLGLAIVNQLVNLHQGKIFAYSEGEDKGATFTVHLPLATTQPSNDPDSTIATKTENRGEISLNHIQVLVVEDVADSRNFIKAALEQAGADVIAVASANEAIKYLKHTTPHILVSDISMPGEDGYYLIRQIREQEQQRDVPNSAIFKKARHIPAIALTAGAKPEDRAQALSAGFQNHISKPVEPQVLVATIAKLVRDREPVLPLRFSDGDVLDRGAC
ncbi:MAG: response regulator [Myxacorys chilensis ATA2-1-KO14]|jgi:signal transduction histidine kinase|nr:response regulator [Myxacorys chilensis ATA2-1-KO14]